MSKSDNTFQDFLTNVTPGNLEFVSAVHDLVLQGGGSYKIEAAKSGHVLSYLVPKTKKVLLNYVFRKGGLMVRVYGDNIAQYAEYLETLPDGMKKAVAQAPACKRLHDFTKCNARCPMGYIFTLDGAEHKKCRYGCFLFPVTEEYHAALRELIENEWAQRRAG